MNNVNEQAKIRGGNEMEIKVSAHVNYFKELEVLVAELAEIEKEHNVSCALDVVITPINQTSLEIQGGVEMSESKSREWRIVGFIKNED